MSYALSKIAANYALSSARNFSLSGLELKRGGVTRFWGRVELFWVLAPP